MAISMALTSCKKEEPDTDKPTVTLDKPVESHVVNIGYVINVQGSAYDNIGLDSLIFTISAKDASYDYHYSSAISLSGLSQSFDEWINISSDACVGTATFTVQAKDTTGNKSEIISRTLQLRDKIDPYFDTLTSQVDDGDSLIFTYVKNENGVFDSLSIYNYTTTQYLAFITDTGGFERTVIYRGADQDTPQIIEEDLSEITENVFVINFKVILDPNFNLYYLHLPFLDVMVKEFRNPVDLNTSGSEADNGHHILTFEVNE